MESLPSNEHSYTLPKDSCLRITFGSPLFCHPGGLCNATATEIIHSAQVENGRIPYSIKVKNVMPGLYRLGVNLRMGSCDQNQRGDDWLKENCYKRQVQTITVPESKSEMSEDLKIHEFEDSGQCHLRFF